MHVSRDLQHGGFAWREAGDGTLIVLLHGLGGGRTSWEPQLADLSAHHRVAAWDMPGYGASAPLPVATVTFRHLADAGAEAEISAETLGDLGAPRRVEVSIVDARRQVGVDPPEHRFFKPL